MSADLPEKLIGISIDDPDDRQSGGDERQEERERFLVFEIGGVELAAHVDEIETVTDPPTSVTRVPRTPPAIEGVTDLRGEIVAVVDPLAHFPVERRGGDVTKLVVLDRPGDGQPAAIYVDGVRGVETVPERAVVAVADLGDRSPDLADHPLVPTVFYRDEPDAGDRDAGGEPTAEYGDADRDPVPIIDVDDLLLASGPRDDRSE